MLSISNTWGMMRNSISYSRIIEIAAEARENVSENNARVEALSYSPKMRAGERIFDYVFCGSVKKEFMEQLYKMSHERARLEILTKDDTTDRNMNNEESASQRASRYQHRMKIKGKRIESMLSGNSLQFGTDPFQNDTFRETYLIYRDNVRRTSVGLALKLQSPPPQTPLQTIPIILIPQFGNAEQIQLRNLDDVRKYGKLGCGEKTYDVRFTENNEPIVMQSNKDPQAELIQKRLLNLWAIQNVKQRLVEFRNRPCECAILRTPPDSHGWWKSYARTDPAFTQWNHYVGDIQKKFVDAVSDLEENLEHQSKNFDNELNSFAQLSNPTWDEKRAFLKLQERITALDRHREKAKECIQRFDEQLMSFFGPVKLDGDPATLEALKNRMLNFTDQLRQLLLTDLEKVEVEKFEALCEIQNNWHTHFSFERFAGLMTPPKIQTWEHTLHPPILLPEQNNLLGMLQDPAIHWEAFMIAMKALKVEQDTRIELRIRQSELGDELAGTVHYWPTYRIPDCHNRSSEFIRLIDLFIQMRDRLLLPVNNFTSTELDAIAAQRDEYRAGLWKEYRRLDPALQRSY